VSHDDISETQKRSVSSLQAGQTAVRCRARTFWWRARPRRACALPRPAGAARHTCSTVAARQRQACCKAAVRGATHSEGRSTSVMPASSFRKARDDVAAVSCARKTRQTGRSHLSMLCPAASRLDGGDDGAGVGQQEGAGLNLQVQLSERSALYNEAPQPQ
jgi:hypothetical protein